MFNIGAGEMILIALVLLIAVGPEQLPGVIRRTGRVVGQLKAMSDNLRRDFNNSLNEIERAADVKNWAGPELESTVESVKEAATEPFKTDFTIDGSTKVTDIWASPAAKNDADPEVDESEQVAADTTSAGEAGESTEISHVGQTEEAGDAGTVEVDADRDTDLDANADTGRRPDSTGEVA